MAKSDCSSEDLNTKPFPENFLFGFASASYQIEGAWNEDCKGENIWDRATHSVPSPILNNDTGDVACDSYHKYKEDVAMLKELGATVYRFSISWSRILPTGYLNNINGAGIAYYKNLIKELKDNKIEPLITIFHWDSPQPLQDIGGWPNELMVERFVEYVKVLYDNFGDEVKYWITFNEPKQICQMGYGTGLLAPFIVSPGIADYLSAHNLIKAHAEAWHLYDKQYRKKQKGIVGLCADTPWFEANTTKEEDIAAAERTIEFNFGWYFNPVTNGDYPLQMKEFIARRSAKEGFSHSRLPEFTKEEIEHIKGTVDFIGLNYYTSFMVTNINEENSETSWASTPDTESITWQKEEWPGCASPWIKIVPWGLRKTLNWIKKRYGDIPVIITENGMSDNGSTLEDDDRISYFKSHLSNVRDAMDDGVNIFGYTAWSIMDNFEWFRGYSDKFGIYSVDFNDPNRKRTPKKSATFFKKFYTTKSLLNV